MLLDTLGATLLGNTWLGKSVVRGSDGAIWEGQGTNRAGYDFNIASSFN